MSGVAHSHSQRLWRGAPLVLLVATMLLVPIRDARPDPQMRVLSVGEIDPVLALIDLLTGQLLLVAGGLAWLLSGRAHVGVLAVAAGACWFGPDLFALSDADPLLRLVGHFVLMPMLVPVLVHLTLAATGEDGGRRARTLIVALYLFAATVSAGSLVTYDAFRDLHCIDCTWDNPLGWAATRGAPRTWQLARAALLVAGATAAGMAALAAWRPPHTGPRLVMGAGSLVIAVAAAAMAFGMVVAPTEDPRDALWRGAWLTLSCGASTIALGVIWSTLRGWVSATRIRAIARSLEAAPAPGTLGVALTRALGDHTVVIAFATGSGDQLIDAGGQPVDLSREATQRRISVERRGERLAVVEHAPHVDSGALVSAFTPTLLMALDNERLRAARLAQLHELRSSRARIVALGDAERQRLERDLHDGAQQLLLAVLFDVRLVHLDADRAGDRDRGAAMAAAEADAQEAIEALRRLAHGIYPTVLARSGLLAALRSLAAEAPVAVSVHPDQLARLAESVETTAYLTVARQVEDAVARGARYIAVDTHQRSDQLLVEIRDDGRVPVAAVPARIVDRVGAAGDRAWLDQAAGGGTLLRVELPCV